VVKVLLNVLKRSGLMMAYVKPKLVNLSII
jgi:hypothetical protein